MLRALFFDDTLACAPTSAASDIVNERHKYKKVNMTNTQQDNHGGTKALRKASERHPHVPQKPHTTSSSAFLNQGIKRVHIRARSVSGSSVAGVRLAFLLLSP